MSLISIRIRKSFTFEWLCTRTRFETEACSNSEMGYYVDLLECRLQWPLGINVTGVCKQGRVVNERFDHGPLSTVLLLSRPQVPTFFS